jgi:zinc transport system ATP-binding protein
MNNEAILELTNINLSFSRIKILEDINISIKRGEILTIIGPNGSGKTSLAKLILGIIKPDSGAKKIKDNINIGYMPQKISIDPQLPLTVERFLTLSSKQYDKDIMQGLAAEIGITPLLKREIQNISGGEMQRLMLARSLLFNPELLVLDEPIQGVDITGQAEFYNLIEKLRKTRNIAIIMISHDLYMVMKTTDHVLCLNRHICCQGTPEDISKHPSYIKLFGNDALKALAVYSHHHDHLHSPCDD